MNEAAAEPEQAPTLVAVLHHATLRVVMVSILLAGASMFVLGIIALRFYTLDNLALSARSVAYAIEAAVVFEDREAATEELERMIANRPVATAYVFDRDGAELIHWQTKETGGLAALDKLVVSIFLDQPIIEPIHHNGRQVGRVELRGSGRDLTTFVWVGLVCALISFILCAVAAAYLSRRAASKIAEPLRYLAAITAKARHEHHFRQRVEPAAIAELRHLGDNFNALLAELAAWQEKMRDDNQTLAHQASHDPLTGLANRAHFEARLEQTLAMTRAREAAGDAEHSGHVALFFIDADRFKSINDELGHEIGDIVLCTIARRLRAKIRESDLVARLGGDEFAVLLSSLHNSAQASRIASGMVESMGEPIELPPGMTLTASLSIGIAFFPDHATDAAGLLKKADAAMYEAKRGGGNMYAIASQAEDEPVLI
ncbi:MAG: diguanylate cyclase [Azonexus sp.]|jgi:diguanylate cyclase (GGDEF)-like protein|nr:diguanylate cyclase [Azonexus sp.]